MKFQEIREATQNDQILIKVCDAINNNRWRFYKNDINIKPYYVLRKELIFHDGVILRKQKLVIPHCLRHSVLRLAHEGHIALWNVKQDCAARFGGHISILKSRLLFRNVTRAKPRSITTNRLQWCQFQCQSHHGYQ